MDPVTGMMIGQGVKAGVDLGKTIWGASMAKKGTKELKKYLNEISYTRPEEYQDILSLYQKRAGRNELPGQDLYEQKLGESTARGIESIKQLSDSPVSAQIAALGLKQKEYDAIRDLNLQFAQYKDQAEKDLAKVYEMGAGYSDKENYYNDFYKKQVMLNLAGQKINAGYGMMGSGMEGLGSDAMNYFGTKYYMDMMNGLNPNIKTVGGGGMNPEWNPTIPAGYGVKLNNG